MNIKKNQPSDKYLIMLALFAVLPLLCTVSIYCNHRNNAENAADSLDPASQRKNNRLQVDPMLFVHKYLHEIEKIFKDNHDCDSIYRSFSIMISDRKEQFLKYAKKNPQPVSPAALSYRRSVKLFMDFSVQCPGHVAGLNENLQKLGK